jgi:hypothetical protein
MHDRKASDGVATNMTNIDTAITATGMGTLRSDTDVASAEVSLVVKSTN